MAEAGVVGGKVQPWCTVGAEEQVLAALVVEEGLPDLGEDEFGWRRPVWGPGACWV